MLNRKTKAILFIFLILFSIAAVNAESMDDNVDIESIKNVNIESGTETITISDETSGSFTELNSAINDGTENNKEVKLTKNYAYNNSTDQEFKIGIIINKNITIDGQGHTIDGNHLARIFQVTNKGTLTIKNLILINGNTTNQGAGIHSKSENILTIINSTFINNTSYDETNIAKYPRGGAIYSNSETLIVNSTFNNNDAIRTNTRNVFAQGGAINIEQGNLTIINSTFNNNTAEDGGAIYVHEEAYIINSTFIENKAKSITYAAFGGAVTAGKSLISINSTFVNNTANAGGGAIYCGGMYGYTELINSTFIHNGGYAAIVVHEIVVANSKFYDQGNTVINCYEIDVDNSEFNNNRGSAIDTKFALVTNSKFYNNTATEGGAITASNIIVVNSTFIQNSAEKYGGAICKNIYEDPYMNIINSTFINNTAAHGGALSILCNARITGSTFIGNNATNGGAILISVGNVTIIKSEFIKNNATKGGAISYVNSYFDIHSKYPNLNPYEDWEIMDKLYEEYPESVLDLFYPDMYPDPNLFLDILISVYSSSFDENWGEYGDDIYTEYNLTVLGNNYTKGCYANIYANNTIINGTIASVLENGEYFVNYMDKFKINTTVFVDGASVAGYDLTITDGTDSYKTEYLGNGTYEITKNMTADFKTRQYTAIINNNTTSNRYTVENGTVVTNKKSDLTINVTVDDASYGENITGNITLTDNNGNIANVTGEITIEVNGRNYTANVTNGTGNFVIDDKLDAGNYTLNAAFKGNEDYNPSNSTTDFEIDKANPNLEVNITDIEGNLTMDIIMNPDINGNVTVIIDNETFVVEIRNGSGRLDLSNLESGTHEFTVSFEGNNNYNPAEAEGKFDIDKGIILEVNDLTKYYGNDRKLEVRLRDSHGNPMANQTVTIKINGVTYTRTTDENGQILMNINLIPGVYETEVSYENLTETINVTIISTIQAKDLIKYFKNGSQYYAKFLNVDGTPLTNTNVTFNIHGVFYTRTTDENGIAKLNINLNPKEYIITAFNPVNNESESNVITVLSTIFGENVIKFYRNGTQYYAYVLDENGNALVNGTVTFNIHGVFYNRTTDEKGIVKLNINLNPGKYIITAWNLWNGEATSNNITVDTVVESKDLEMTTTDRKPFKVTILGEQGEPLANAEVTFNIHGVFYHKTTDANGQISLDINLIAGKYIITTYYNEYGISNTIIVK